MPDPQTSNLDLYIPARGADVGTWDTPNNANFSQLDSVLGGVATIALTNVNVTLSAAQYNCGFINLTGNLTGNVVLTFPAKGRFYIVNNQCTAASQVTFSVTATTGGGTTVGFPPFEPVQIYNDGTNIRYVGLGRVGEYLDLGIPTIPVWITAASPNPYLLCDGGAFNGALFPALAAYLGGTTLPDARGRVRYALNDGTGRMTAINANTILSAGGSQTLIAANLPPITFGSSTLSVGSSTFSVNISDPGHQHSINQASLVEATGAGGTPKITGGSSGQTTNSATTGITASLSGTGTVSGTLTSSGTSTVYSGPGYVGGITLIRAA